MKRLAFIAFAVAALLLPAAAAAKGPSEAKITGPGLDSTVTITGNLTGSVGGSTWPPAVGMFGF